MSTFVESVALRATVEEIEVDIEECIPDELVDEFVNIAQNELVPGNYIFVDEIFNSPVTWMAHYGRFLDNYDLPKAFHILRNVMNRPDCNYIIERYRPVWKTYKILLEIYALCQQILEGKINKDKAIADALQFIKERNERKL